MEAPDFVVPILSAAALLIVVVPWLRSRSYRALSPRALAAAMNWNAALVYIDLTIVAGGLGAWVVYHGTFGRVHSDGPSDLMLVVSGFAACAIAFAGILLPFYRLTAAALAFGGLTIAIAAFASTIAPRLGEISRQPYSVALIGLAIVGMFLVARSARG
jgi:hypothetical protein